MDLHEKRNLKIKKYVALTVTGLLVLNLLSMLLIIYTDVLRVQVTQRIGQETLFLYQVNVCEQIFIFSILFASWFRMIDRLSNLIPERPSKFSLQGPQIISLTIILSMWGMYTYFLYYRSNLIWIIACLLFASLWVYLVFREDKSTYKAFSKGFGLSVFYQIMVYIVLIFVIYFTLIFSR